MKTIFVTVASVASLFAAIPAIAAPAIPAKPAVAAAAAVAADSTSARQANPQQRICFVDTITGSRIPVRHCDTRANWSRMGVDVQAVR